MEHPLAVDVGHGVCVSYRKPLTIIAGPCQLESVGHAVDIAYRMAVLCKERGLQYIFKGSFDKANRTSAQGKRGVGMGAGLMILEDVRAQAGCPVTTDIHTATQAVHVGQSVDLIQIPSLLSRQTDIIHAAAMTGRPVNVKKGQFMAASDVEHAACKADEAAYGSVPPGFRTAMVTERGTTFGYHDLVVDMRNLQRMSAGGRPVIFDASHTVQSPSGNGNRSGGDRTLTPVLARAAVAAGVSGVFLEVHEEPERAPSDGPSMTRLRDVPALLDQLVKLDAAVKLR